MEGASRNVVQFSLVASQWCTLSPVAQEIIFLVTEDPDGGYVAEALGESIATQGEDLADLREMVLDAVRCHFDEGEAPPIVRLHFVREEVLAV